jgi:hypothetical protein
VPALRALAAWQGLGELEVVDRGDLARAVAVEAGVALVEPE